MNAGKRIAIAMFIVMALAVLSVAALYISSGVFLVANKHNPLEIQGPWDIVTFWQAYGDDPALRQKLTVSSVISFLLCFVAAPIALFTMARKGRPLHGDARFARFSEIRKAGLLEKRGIIVGKFGKHYLTLGGQLFALLAAPTRSGKGVGIVIPNLLQWPDSVMVLDIKGENYEITSGFRARFGQAVYAFRPFDQQGATHRYNPLMVVRHDPLYRVGDLQSIAAILYPLPARDDSEGSAKFFTDKARDLFVGLGLYLMETPELAFTLGELLRQSSGRGKSVKEYLHSLIAERDRTDRPLSDDCVNAFDRLLSSSENTMGNIVSSFNAPLAIFADPIVDAATSASDFSLADVRKRPMSIYLVIPPKKLPVCGLVVNLLFSQLIEQNTDELPRDNPSLKYQCLLLMDEFAQMGRVAILSKGVSYIAGYNLRFLTIIQSMAQLSGVYGKDEARTFSTNHALQILYAPKEQEDAEDYSKMLGTFTQKAESRGRSQSFGGRSSSSSSTNESDQRRALMMPQELRELGTEREIVVMENCKPILCDKMRYYDDPTFMGRLRAPVPVPRNDVLVHLAKLQQRVREARIADVESGIDLGTLAHNFDSLPPLEASASKEEVAGFVDEFFDCLGIGESTAKAESYPARNMIAAVDEAESIDLAELEN